MRIRDEEGHRAMQAAGKAWKAIKITSMRTWTDWTEVVGPGLMKAREEALSVSDSKAPIGSAYNKAMGALLQEYGFGDTLERKRSEVTRADLLHCMDHLNEIKTWLRCYPDQTVLNHPSVVWRRFKASKDGKRLLNARNGDVPAKQSKMARKVVDLEAEIEHLREQLAAAEVAGPRPVTGEAPAAPLQPTGTEPNDVNLRRAYVALMINRSDHDKAKAALELVRGFQISIIDVVNLWKATICDECFAERSANAKKNKKLKADTVKLESATADPAQPMYRFTPDPAEPSELSPHPSLH